MTVARPLMAVNTPDHEELQEEQARQERARSFQWDVDEALSRVSYGIFLHVKHQSQPDESELVGWWHQLLNTQVAIGALLDACEHLLPAISHPDAHQQLSTALSRVNAAPQVAP
jgi:hypothetical protein